MKIFFGVYDIYENTLFFDSLKTQKKPYFIGLFRRISFYSLFLVETEGFEPATSRM